MVPQCSEGWKPSCPLSAWSNSDKVGLVTINDAQAVGNVLGLGYMLQVGYDIASLFSMKRVHAHTQGSSTSCGSGESESSLKTFFFGHRKCELIHSFIHSGDTLS